MKYFFGILLGLCSLTLRANEKYYVTCDVTLVKDTEPDIKCNKLIFSNQKTEAEIQTLHDEAFKKYKSESAAYSCYRENDKGRIQKQIFTVCHNDKKDRYRVFQTSEPVDTRSIIYSEGLKMKWFENDAGVFLYKRYLLPKASWRQWLLP